jgi:hypothetical protein
MAEADWYAVEPVQCTVEPDAVPQTGSTRIVPGISSRDRYEKDTFLDEDFDIVAAFDATNTSASEKPNEIKAPEEFEKFLKSNKVPVSTSLIIVMGLPMSGKSNMIEQVFANSIKLKDGRIEYYIERGRVKNGLSLHSLCILGKDGDYVWSFSSKRLGVVYSLICSAIRQNSTMVHCQLHGKSDDFLVHHLDFLLLKVREHEQCVRDDTKKATLMYDGVSLVNVMDIGVNKAVFDLLPIILLFCRNHVRYVNYSLERDGGQEQLLHNKPDLKHQLYMERKDNMHVMSRRMKIDYLLNFASTAHNGECATIIMATDIKETSPACTYCESKYTNLSIPNEVRSLLDETKGIITQKAEEKGVSQCLDKWQYVHLDDHESIIDRKKAIEQLVASYKRHQMEVPLKWMVLRSFLVSLVTDTGRRNIFSRDFIQEQALKVEMYPEEVNQFLKVFTGFGSLLHMESFTELKDLVIIDILEFAKLLDKLYYPDEKYCNLQNFGIVSQTLTKMILGPDEENFMKITTTLAMTAKISNGKFIEINGKPGPDEVCYYLPSARVGDIQSTENTPEDAFAFLKIESANFSTNVQACITHSIMSNSEKAILVSCEKCNVTKLKFKHANNKVVHFEIEKMYGDTNGGKTKLKIITDEILSNEAVDSCTVVLMGCCEGLTREVNLVRKLTFNIAITCYEHGQHYLFNDENPCTYCQKNYQYNLLYQCWKEAARNCKEKMQIHLLIKENQGSQIILKKNMPLEPKHFSFVACEINNTFESLSKEIEKEEKLKRLAQDLNLSEEDNKYLLAYEDETRRIMLMLMMWERECKGIATKNLLAKILVRLDYKNIAEKLISI